MKSIIVDAYGGPEVLKLKNINQPSPKDNEVLIEIKATSITSASTFMRKGTPYFGRLFMGLTKPKTKTPGTDLSGIVAAIGKKVSKFKIGDRVMAETGLECGTYAEYICLPEDGILVHQPQNISHEEATGIIDGGSTALSFFTDTITIKPGQKVLINGASGSIGAAAIQLAKGFGAEVTAVCSGKNRALVMDLGADFMLDYTSKDLEITTQKFDIVFDTVGKMSFFKTKRLMTDKGVFLSPVLGLSTLLTMLFISPFSSKKLKFAATGLRKPELVMRDLVILRDMLKEGKISSVIDRVYKLEQIQEAHSYVDKGHKRGNVVISFQS